MDRIFADRVHAAAAAIAGGMYADPNVKSLDRGWTAREATQLVLAVDAAIAAHQPAPQPEPTADALRDAYHLGVSDGRANPWLPAACDKPDLVIAFSADRDELMLKAPGLVQSDELWVPAPPIAVPFASR
jgi:hypothetical protein